MILLKINQRKYPSKKVVKQKKTIFLIGGISDEPKLDPSKKLDSWVWDHAELKEIGMYWDYFSSY